jgi:hypothetical protein
MLTWFVMPVVPDLSTMSKIPGDGGMDLIKEHVGDAVRIVPSWTPDRNLYNQIFRRPRRYNAYSIPDMLFDQIHPTVSRARRSFAWARIVTSTTKSLTSLKDQAQRASRTR